jgi:hypothetical protein
MVKPHEEGRFLEQPKEIDIGGSLHYNGLTWPTGKEAGADQPHLSVHIFKGDSPMRENLSLRREI